MVWGFWEQEKQREAECYAQHSSRSATQAELISEDVVGGRESRREEQATRQGCMQQSCVTEEGRHNSSVRVFLDSVPDIVVFVISCLESCRSGQL